MLRFSFVKSLIDNSDAYSGNLLNIQFPVFTPDPNVLSGSGVVKPEEWGITRKNSEFGVVEKDLDRKYLEYIFTKGKSKIETAIGLTKIMDFASYKNIFELGCGYMIQAFCLINMYPHMRYTATDFDPYVIDTCSQIPLLGGIIKYIFDIDNYDMNGKGIDLVISFALDYALSDEELLRLFKKTKNNKAHYLMCSPSVIGILRYCHYLLKKKELTKLSASKKIRMHGLGRSLGAFKQLAERANLEVQYLGRVGTNHCLLFR